MSTSPGAATRPRPSILFARLRSAGESDGTIRPSRAKRSPIASRRLAGSITRARLIHGEGMGLFGCGDDVLGLEARAQVKDRHADRDPVGDLLQDDAALAVGELAVDLHAPVDRA